MLVPTLALIFLVVAISLFVIASRQKLQAGIPPGRVIYVDTNRWGKVEKPLYAPDLRLSGKPDYLVQQDTQIIPVEVKSSRAPQAPYDAHIYQLAAYCLLIANVYGIRPKFGIIHYLGRSFEVNFTPELENSTVSIIHKMQAITVRTRVDRSHENPRICQHCGYRSICDQSLRI